MGASLATGRRHCRLLARAKAVILAAFLLGSLPIIGHAKADTASGNDYRELRTAAGSLNTGTSVSIGTLLGDSGNYVIDPYTTGSQLKGSPGSSTVGYGWKTAGFLGQSVPAGTWSFDVQTQTGGVTLGTGEAFVQVRAYSTDMLGANAVHIGSATSSNDLLTLLGGTEAETLTFSASAIDMTDRVLVVEYWVIVQTVPLLAATVNFHTGSSVASVEVPTSSPTTFYLLPAHMVAFGDSFSVSDSAGRVLHAPRGPAENLAASDSAGLRVTRPVSEVMATTEQIRTRVSRSMGESVGVTDDPDTDFGPAVASAITVDDTIAGDYSAFRSTTDSIAFDDSISTAVTRSITDALATSDALSGKVTLRALSDQLSTSDAVSPHVSRTRSTTESLAVADGAARVHSASPGAADAVAVSDSLAATAAFARQAAETIAVAEQPAPALGAARSMSDIVTLDDSLILQPGPADQLSVADSISIALSRSLQDSVAVQDLADRSQGSLLTDSVQVQDQITGVSVSWSRGFEESLALGDCTPFSCNQALQLEEGLALAGTFSPPPEVAEGLSVNDSITVAVPKGTADALAIASSAGTTVQPLPQSPPDGSPLPALGALIVSDPALASLLPSEPVPGTYSMPDGDPAQLIDQLGQPVLEIENVSSDLPGMTLVLPTYHVNLEPSDELPGDDALLTVRVAEIPAETGIIVPVDIASTPAASEHDNFPSMTLEFTPAVDASDFALVVSIVDAPPGGAPEPAGDLFPLYLDVRWVGTFGGGVDPGAGGFYSEPPDFTFAITDEWADENSVERDGNGVPAIALNLLDESTGEWEEVDDIDVPLAANDDGEYVYVAHLEHFSSYAISAETAGGSGGGGGSAGARLSVRIADSIALVEEQHGEHIGVIEEFASSQFAVQLLDSVSINSRPVAYWPLQAGETVDVFVTVADIRSASLFPPAAKALVRVDIANTGAEAAGFVLELWHGERESGSSSAVEIGPGRSKQLMVEVPIASHGEQVLNAETRTAEGNLIAFRQMTVDVPWITVYLHLVVALLGGLAAAASAGLYLFVRQRIA